MPADIDVDEDELARFIESLSVFQERILERMNALNNAWDKYVYQGNSASEFKQEFEATGQKVQQAITVGDETLDWLRRFHSIVKEF